MRSGEEQAVLTLVLDVFDRLVAPDFTRLGVEEFVRAARRFLLDRPAGHEVVVALADGRVIGTLDLRDGEHICLFFVDEARQRRGVGRSLLSFAERHHARADVLTVNSGPSAVSAYRSLGFVPAAEEAEVNGIRYVAMRKELRLGNP
jgi:GNAT superfamily N-acetyltransferase